jgi:hypothetical protein
VGAKAHTSAVYQNCDAKVCSSSCVGFDILGLAQFPVHNPRRSIKGETDPAAKYFPVHLEGLWVASPTQTQQRSISNCIGSLFEFCHVGFDCWGLTQFRCTTRRSGQRTDRHRKATSVHLEGLWVAKAPPQTAVYQIGLMPFRVSVQSFLSTLLDLFGALLGFHLIS